MFPADPAIDCDDLVCNVRSPALAERNAELQCSWPQLHMCVETLRVLKREPCEEPFALPRHAPWSCSLRLPHKIRLKRLVRLSHSVSRVNLCDEEMQFV